MDQAAASLLLKQVLGHLPPEWWWMLHQDEENDLGLARAFRRPRAEIDALLINAGIGKETSLGFGIQKKVFADFATSLESPLQIGDRRRV